MNIQNIIFRKTNLSIFGNLTNNLILRQLSLSPLSYIKRIEENKQGNALVVSGVNFPSERSEKLLKEACDAKFCPECTLGLKIKHTDVLIISQYVRSDGCMLPRRVTGLCRRQQRKMSTLVTMAQKAGLIPNLNPPNSKRDPKKRYQWKKFNKYYDENLCFRKMKIDKGNKYFLQ